MKSLQVNKDKLLSAKVTILPMFSVNCMVTTKQKSWTETLNKKGGGNGANHREKPQIYKNGQKQRKKKQWRDRITRR